MIEEFVISEGPLIWIANFILALVLCSVSGLLFLAFNSAINQASKTGNILHFFLEYIMNRDRYMKWKNNDKKI